MKERATFIRDIATEGQYLIYAPASYDMDMLRKKWKPETPAQLDDLSEIVRTCEPFTHVELESRVKAYLETNSIGFGALMPVYRIILTGVVAGPGVFEITELLGRDEALRRLSNRPAL
jgi:glutamyl-tRNA synthetase